MLVCVCVITYYPCLLPGSFQLNASVCLITCCCLLLLDLAVFSVFNVKMPHVFLTWHGRKTDCDFYGNVTAPVLEVILESYHVLRQCKKVKWMSSVMKILFYHHIRTHQDTSGLRWDWECGQEAESWARLRLTEELKDLFQRICVYPMRPLTLFPYAEHTSSACSFCVVLFCSSQHAFTIAWCCCG